MFPIQSLNKRFLILILNTFKIIFSDYTLPVSLPRTQLNHPQPPTSTSPSIFLLFSTSAEWAEIMAKLHTVHVGSCHFRNSPGDRDCLAQWIIHALSRFCGASATLLAMKTLHPTKVDKWSIVAHHPIGILANQYTPTVVIQFHKLIYPMSWWNGPCSNPAHHEAKWCGFDITLAQFGVFII